MTKQVQRRRGTATQHTSFTGAEGELSVNTTNKSVHVHDNVTAGGFEAARADMDNVTSSSILTAAGITATTAELNYVDGVTSAIQTQLDGKAGTASPTFTGTLTTANLTATGTTTLAGASTSADITFGDNDKAIFGAGSDLQIYHDSATNDSIIKESGTGHLRILGDDVKIRDVNNAEMYIDAVKNGAVGIYYDNSRKLATTSTGIDVTGTVTADGLTVDGNVAIGLASTNTWSTGYAIEVGTEQAAIWGAGDQIDITGNAYFNSGWKAAATKSGASKYEQALGSHNFAVSGSVTADSAITFKQALNIANNGDISFYEDTGTTPKLFWDASAENLGIGTISPATPLHIVTSGNTAATFHSTTDNSNLVFTDASTTANVAIGAVSGDNFRVQIANAERMRIDSSGNVGIGVVTPTERLDIQTTAGRFKVKALGGSSVELESNSAVKLKAAANDVILDGASNIIFDIADAEKMRIDSSGNVNIATPSAYSGAKLSVNGSIVQANGTQHVIGTYGTSGLQLIGTAGGDNVIGTMGSSEPLIFRTASAERMRLDSSGNLLVGATSSNYGAVGSQIGTGGNNYMTRSGAQPLLLNRLTSDGDIVAFYKDSASVGSIGSNAGAHLTMGSGDTGLLFNASTDKIHPWNMSTQGVRDNAVDLGVDVSRFKDLYLSGGVYLGGTGAANKLDDYEEGTWTGTLDFFVSSTGSLAYTSNTLRYVKIGNQVSIFGAISWSANNFSASSGALCLTGLPFTGTNNNSRRGGANIHYAETPWASLTIYQQTFREEVSETKMTFNFSTSTNGNLTGTTDNYTNIDSTGTLFISGSYFTD